MEEASNTQNPGKKSWLGVVVILIILALAAATYWYLEKSPSTESGMGDTAIIIDGDAIDRATLDRSIEQITSTYAAQGVDVTAAEASTAIKEQAITALVNRQLMINAATKSGIEVTNEQIEAQFQTALQNVGGQENLTAALSKIGMTEDDLRADIKNDVMINGYLEAKLSINSLSVSEEEVKAAYNTAAEANSEEVPPLEDVAELIKNQLLLEKQQQAIAAELERLRAEAKIEILV